MAWYYANQGQQAGPVDDGAFDNLVRQGVVRDDTLVWKDGMASWQAYGTVKPQSMAAEKTVVMKIPSSVPTPSPAPSAPQASAMDTRFCSQCGRPTLSSQLTMVNGAPTCPACAAVLRPAAAAAPAPTPQPYNPQPMGGGMGQPNMGGQGMGGGMGQPNMGGQGMGGGMGQPMGGGGGGWAQAPTVALNMGQMAQQPMGGIDVPPPYAGSYYYAGFWIRFVARLIDGVILGIIVTILAIPLSMIGVLGSAAALSGNPNDPAAGAAFLGGVFATYGLVILAAFAVQIGYEGYFLSTRGATLGKMALSLKVIRTDGGTLSFGQAAVRDLVRIFLSGIFAIGYIIAGFDPQKRSLHDRLGKTYVIAPRVVGSVMTGR